MVRYRQGHETLTILRAGMSSTDRKADAKTIYNVRQLTGAWAVEECRVTSKGLLAADPVTRAVFATEADADWLARALAGHADANAHYHRFDFPAPRKAGKAGKGTGRPVSPEGKARHHRVIMGGKRNAS